MARKNLLQGLMNAPAPSEPGPGDARLPAGNSEAGAEKLPAGNPAPPPVPQRRTGALGAVGRSFERMRENAVIEIPADMIDGAGLEDRLGEEGLEALAASLRDYGQQVPVLVRHSPNHEGRYEVVYGRRRVAALRRNGQKVRAMVRNLPDRELIVAQGQENTARVELSWIEKANFARQMAGMGFETKVICDALSVEKTAVSKMARVTDAIPLPLIRAIGPAPGIGRDRWLTLAVALRDPEAALAATEGPADSDARFEAALAAVTRKPPAPARDDARSWGRLRATKKGTAITVPASPFGDWLAGRLDELHARWAEETATSTEDEDR
ncbi:plasmid partitioning protein RepB [Jannaschia formosa]|uniref:plasmid partitioning protein RepB n=1 Tax=Jannaschia formosa TaxID=2259592 RepID=UPI000E1B73DC|nr:plasmid partitioning protein RepB [Jannaschia formosa]TFL16326.1 plasmid partitioning protein RepB [Jannaschia formosa]